MSNINNTLSQCFLETRQKTIALCKSLEIEDYVIQTQPDVSPPKWHLAHTTWFFECFILKPFKLGYKEFNPLFHHLFNSYYQSLGTPFLRECRGGLARPTVKTIFEYREYINYHILELLSTKQLEQIKNLHYLLTLGLNHEQQHQELLLMDIKYNFYLDPSVPAYHSFSTHETKAIDLNFISYCGDTIGVGHKGNNFCFDNELPHHTKIIYPYTLANRLVTNGEYMEFINDGGYSNYQWWLSDGWECVRKNQWHAPLYWLNDHQNIFTLHGIKKINFQEPVSHISFYEADAFARWKGCRLPLEEEWEHAARQTNFSTSKQNFLENDIFHPQPVSNLSSNTPCQLLGDLWEWTTSPYSAYPGFKPLNGALGEYNAKFMSNQMVLRGGACVTPKNHIRLTYRNFYSPHQRWLFSGIRLATNC